MQKIKNTLITVFVSLALFGGIVFIARQDKTALPVSVEAGALAAEESRYDFGRISMAAGNVSRVFRVKNNSADSVIVSKIYTSCMCTLASIKTKDGVDGPFGMPGHGFMPKVNRVISPGEEAEVEVTFDPAAHGPAGIGFVERTIYLESGKVRPLELVFSVTVTP